MVVAVIMAVKTIKKGKQLFTANYYNTTSTILVNGIKEPHQFLDQYTKIVNKIPKFKIKSVNESIKQSCGDAISNNS